MKIYPVSLGINPEGAKEVQGDCRTPEGIYSMVPHHPSPSFGSCFYINYPNKKDAERGLHMNLINSIEYQLILEKLKNNERPPYNTELGGLILLHGTRVRNIKSVTDGNWTIGCIAMENEDLMELLKVYHTSDRPLLTINP